MKKTSKNPEQSAKGMSVVVKTITRITVGILFLYGVNVVLHANTNPGGGFAGGGIMAMALINLILAFGKDEALEKLKRSWALIIAGLGLFMFLVLSVIGLYEDDFMKYFSNHNLAMSKFFNEASIVLFNVSICVEISVGIFAIFLSLIAQKIIEDKK